MDERIALGPSKPCDTELDGTSKTDYVIRGSAVRPQPWVSGH